VSLSAEVTGMFVGRRQPRLLNGAADVLAGVTDRSEWHLPLPVLLLLLVDLTLLKCFVELIFLSEYAKKLTTLLYSVKTTTPIDHAHRVYIE